MLLVDSTFTTRGFGGIAQDNRDFVREFRQYRDISFLFDTYSVLENTDDKILRLLHVNSCNFQFQIHRVRKGVLFK